MKKIIVGVLLLLVVAGFGAPFVSGLVMENVVKQSFSNLNTLYSDTGSDVSVEILRYDRKFSSTEIEWKIQFGSMKAMYGVEEILFLDRAEHRFTGIVSTTSLEKNKWFTDFVSNKLDGKNPLSIITEYTLSGQINSTITLEAFALPVESEMVEIRAGRALFVSDEELRDFFSEVVWEGFAVVDKMSVDGVSMTSSMEKISTYLWDGTFSLGIQKSNIKESENDQFVLENVKVDYNLDIDGEENTVSIVAALGADRLQSGPEKVANAFARIGVINMDAQGFEEFLKLYTEIGNSLLKEIAEAGDDPEEMRTILQEQVARTQFQMLMAYERLLKKGLEIQISDVQAQLPEGEIKGDAVLRLEKDMTFAQFVPLVQQPALVLDIIFLQSDMSLPAVLVGENPMLLSPLYAGMQTGMFVKNGETLNHKAETRDSKLYLNGLEVVFP
ncbi:MAG: DUF945 family protein [Desulforhopalus sp.]